MKKTKIADTYEFTRDILTAITDEGGCDGTVYHMFDMAALFRGFDSIHGVEFGEDK